MKFKLMKQFLNMKCLCIYIYIFLINHVGQILTPSGLVLAHGPYV